MPKLPSVFVKRSSGSCRVTYLNRTPAVERPRLLADRPVTHDLRVREVRLFGSLARREAAPGSDADVLSVLSKHPAPRWFDRIPEFAAAFDDTDMPVEVFPHTAEELARLEAGGSGLARAGRAGLLLVSRV